MSATEMKSLKIGRRPTQEQLQVLRERRASQYTGKTAHFALCVFNLMNAILGSGILGLANALANLGYIPFTVLLVLVAVLAFYSIRLLIQMCDLSGITAYEAIGKNAFGMAGKLATALSIFVHTLGAMCSFLFIVKYELPEVIRTLTGADKCSSAWYLNGDIIVILVTVVVIAPLASTRNIGFLGYTSGFAMGCMVLFTVVIVVQKFIISCPLYGTDTVNGTADHDDILSPYNNETMIPISNVTESSLLQTLYANVSSSFNDVNASHKNSVECTRKNFFTDELEDALREQTCNAEPFILNSKSAYAVPTMVFAFQCHASVLPIYRELEKPTSARMSQVSIVSIGSIFILYFVASLFGYLTFYSSTGPELLLMYSYYDRNNIAILLARIMVLSCVIFSTPLLHFPARRTIENTFFERRPFTWIRHLAIMVCLLTLTVLLVIFVRSIREVFGFIGATSASMLVIILPSLFYIRLGLEPMCSVKKITCACLVMFGILFTIMSITLIILSWVK